MNLFPESLYNSSLPLSRKLKISKTHLAIGSGIKACKAGYKVLFTTLNELSNSLYASLADNSLEERLRALSVPAILIIDEIGYLPLNKQNADFLLQFVAKRYEKALLLSLQTSLSMNGVISLEIR